ncbi:MAG: hypothetical protein MJY88_04080 [Bacteroidales bacterium]|nr:hypothetical protein [Bacteroidales bacterium]
MTKAIHILSTAPSRMKGNDACLPPPFEVVCAVLSALMWKKLNGPVKFYLDTPAYEYFRQLDILDVWDEVDTDVLDNLPDDISPIIFWASSKLLALDAEPAPVAMIDMDIIFWKDLSGIFKDSELTVLHREYINDVYPPKEVLKTRRNYEFDPDWDWTVCPTNTAIAYIKDQTFKDYYLSKAMDFMKGNHDMPMEMVSQMVFAEQRILAMCATQKNIRIDSLIENPFDEKNDLFTHLWGAKETARKYPSQAAVLVQSMMEKIKELDETVHDKLDKAFFGKKPDMEALLGPLGHYVV